MWIIQSHSQQTHSVSGSIKRHWLKKNRNNLTSCQALRHPIYFLLKQCNETREENIMCNNITRSTAFPVKIFPESGGWYEMEAGLLHQIVSYFYGKNIFCTCIIFAHIIEHRSILVNYGTRQWLFGNIEGIQELNVYQTILQLNTAYDVISTRNCKFQVAAEVETKSWYRIPLTEA